jgi:acetate---CoA ligase (ADP-forming)
MSLAAMEKYNRIRSRPAGQIVNYDDVDKNTARDIFQKATEEKRERLTDLEVNEVLAAYGIPMPRFIMVKTLEDLVRVSEQLVYPVVLKVISPQIIHKSDVGGVVLDLRNEVELVRGFMRIQDKIHKLPFKPDYDIMVQEMVTGGKELIMGMNYDPAFGPLLMFGLGGIYVEFIKDVNFRIIPITDLDAREMVTGLKGYKLLEGVRGEKGVDIGAIVETLSRLSQIIGDFPCIKEMDLNPFVAFPPGEKCMALDARIALHLAP